MAHFSTADVPHLPCRPGCGPDLRPGLGCRVFGGTFGLGSPSSRFLCFFGWDGGSRGVAVSGSGVRSVVFSGCIEAAGPQCHGCFSTKDPLLNVCYAVERHSESQGKTNLFVKRRAGNHGLIVFA